YVPPNPNRDVAGSRRPEPTRNDRAQSSKCPSGINPLNLPYLTGGNRMRLLKRIAVLGGAAALAFATFNPVTGAEKHLTILVSVSDLAFPFFVHMVNQTKDEANKL